ncbi:MAG: hypothetical protein RMK91_01050 [Pseudanabaenaceae cyanobacterium SKYGB_i_bin29]|nr:hypothetical protein [Pseudanabaenaceae cyanobacterium SKYG29]MDW8420438.1 hypothetical protein [Pseudanabaenaceae cyanobacterium SKYGB_i_bin29]
MVYSDFTLEMVINKFELELNDRPHLLRETPPKASSQFLGNLLAETTPLALASDRERARSDGTNTMLTKLTKFWTSYISL